MVATRGQLKAQRRAAGSLGASPLGTAVAADTVVAVAGFLSPESLRALLVAIAQDARLASRLRATEARALVAARASLRWTNGFRRPAICFGEVCPTTEYQI